MSIQPVYFAVVSRHGFETPRLFYESLPPDLLRKGSALVYATRLDTIEGGESLLRQPLARLFHMYRLLRKAGKLPPQDHGIKPKQAA